MPAVLEDKASVRPRQLLTEAEIKKIPPVIPLIVSYGMGLNSTALLIEFQKRGVCPDLILFADTGNEIPETYEYLRVINTWLRKVGFPQVTCVSLPRCGKTKYNSLYESLWSTQCLPDINSEAKACSQQWKDEPQNHYCDNWYRTKECWKAGYRAIKVVGYHAGSHGDGRCCESVEGLGASGDSEKYVLWHPLIEWRLSREMLPAIIQDAGLPLPVKSACSFCGERSKPEVLELAEKHPRLAYQAVCLERQWKASKHSKGSTKGLGQTFSWEDFLEENEHYYPADESEPLF